MKQIMNNQNVMNKLYLVSIGLVTAFVVYKVLINRGKESTIIKSNTKLTDETSEFCGCGN